MTLELRQERTLCCFSSVTASERWGVNLIAQWQPTANENPPAVTLVAAFQLSAFHIFRALAFLFPIIQ
jgi:hypothetical protein